VRCCRWLAIVTFSRSQINQSSNETIQNRLLFGLSALGNEKKKAAETARSK
jgi:hypothetical protein